MKGNATTLDKGSRIEFPKGSRIARGECERGREGLVHIPMANAMGKALKNFRKEHGYDPNMDKLLFRGFYTTFDCIVEICEVP